MWSVQKGIDIHKEALALILVPENLQNQRNTLLGFSRICLHLDFSWCSENRFFSVEAGWGSKYRILSDFVQLVEHVIVGFSEGRWNMRKWQPQVAKTAKIAGFSTHFNVGKCQTSRAAMPNFACGVGKHRVRRWIFLPAALEKMAFLDACFIILRPEPLHFESDKM